MCYFKERHRVYYILRKEMVVSLQAGAAQDPEKGEYQDCLVNPAPLPANKSAVFTGVLEILVELSALTTTLHRDSR